KPDHRGGKGYSNAEDVRERNAGEPSALAKVEESSDEEEEVVKKPTRVVMERDDVLEAELEKQFSDASGLSRKQREELEAQAKTREDEKAKREGTSDEAKADKERLEEIRRKRAEAVEKREKDKVDAEAKAAGEAEKDRQSVEVLGKQRDVALEVARLIRESKEGKMTLNQLNQDANCKKVLKPLCKKENIKALNKAWLEKFPDVLKIEGSGNDFTITSKSK
ncbi:unnamed protein product, partial [Polarella glacialis]